MTTSIYAPICARLAPTFRALCEILVEEMEVEEECN